MKTTFTLWLTALIFLWSCHKSTSPSTDSNSNWLADCEKDSDCTENSCVCGVCSDRCDKDSECDRNGEIKTICIDPSIKGIASECASEVVNEDKSGICLPRCMTDDDCELGFRCLQEACVNIEALSSEGMLDGPCVSNGLCGAALECNEDFICVQPDASIVTGSPPDASTADASDNGYGNDAVVTPSNGIILSGELRDNMSASPLSGYVVKALDNSDLSELGAQTTTAVDGSFTLTDLPSGEVCLFAVGRPGEDEQVDTYTHGVRTDEKQLIIQSMAFALAKGIDAALCGDWRTDLGSVEGKVMYQTEDGQEFPVGCATIEVEEATEETVVYYFSDTLPDIGDQSDPTCAEVGGNRITQTSSNGRFYAVNVPVGVVRLKAMVAGQVIGSATLTIRAPEDSTGGQYNHNITRINADNTGNPSPNCTVQ